MLPDLALRGTLYSPRVGTLLAVVAIIAGVPALQVPALSILESSKGTWLATPLVPENFDIDCIRLLLSLPQGSESNNLGNVALTAAEHNSYLSQLRYNNLFTQLDSKVNGHIGWTPFKSRGVGDRKRKCLRCGIRRSETMMHDLKSLTEKDREKLGMSGKAPDENEGACGMCVDCDTKNPEDWKDMGELMSCWVECSEAYCKACYVIEDEEGLRVSLASLATSPPYILSRFPRSHHAVTTVETAARARTSPAQPAGTASSSLHPTDPQPRIHRRPLSARRAHSPRKLASRRSSTSSPRSVQSCSQMSTKCPGWELSPSSRCSARGVRSCSRKSMAWGFSTRLSGRSYRGLETGTGTGTGKRRLSRSSISRYSTPLV